MSLEDIKEGEPYILVEGPRSGDTEFYGQWHLAASKAEALWKQALMDPSFETQIDRLLVVSLNQTSVLQLALCFCGSERMTPASQFKQAKSWPKTLR